MQMIGGEMACPLNSPSALTDSGRSSLRLILNSAAMRGRRFLLPDFICSSILDVFDREQIDYAFYHILPNLTFAPSELDRSDFQALYVINYFGWRQPLPSFKNKDIAIVEDGVFLPALNAPNSAGLWAGFNSFRKIAPAADGSQVSATFPLPLERIRPTPAPFAEIKTQARKLKHDALNGDNVAESTYLHLFRQGETMLDAQTNIHRPSDTAMTTIMGFLHNLPAWTVRSLKNFQELQRQLPEWTLPLTPQFPCFLLLRVNAAQRDNLRKEMASSRIFLPTHWPRPKPDLIQPLYDEIVSIPVDARYNAEDMARIAVAVRSILESK